MSTADHQIADILAKYGEPIAGNIWRVQGQAVVNVNHRVSGRQAAYVYAMAEKRAKDRVILKLIGLHGLLSTEEEADELKSGTVSVAASEDASQGERTLPDAREVETPAKARSAKGKAKG